MKSPRWKIDREAYCAGLLNQCDPKGHQGFESLIFRVNNEKHTILFIFGATLAVMIFLAIFIALEEIGTEWVLLPASWWVGAMMTFAFDKYWKRGRVA